MTTPRQRVIFCPDCDSVTPIVGATKHHRIGSICHNSFGSPRTHRFQSLRRRCRESGSITPARRAMQEDIWVQISWVGRGATAIVASVLASMPTRT